MMGQAIKIAKGDNVAVVLSPIKAGESVEVGGATVTASEDILMGHKVAIAEISEGENIIKYGFPIGRAVKNIKTGEWVHTHNMKTNLEGVLEYTYVPEKASMAEKVRGGTFMGYPRPSSRAGVRNEIWIIPTVGCVNSIAQNLAAASEIKTENVDGVYALSHPYGCSQLGGDHLNTQRALVGLVNHPNAGGVLVLGLGCENNNIEQFKKVLGSYDPERVKFLEAQSSDDEMAEGRAIIEELISYASKTERQPCELSQLVVGLKCGGSDGLSGITANPLVGGFSDLLISRGGSAILTEVPEMFGAETLLMNRAVDNGVFEKTVAMINGFKEYFQSCGQPIYENPSPGNKQGGITTLEDKSLGCVQKGGSAPVNDVLEYGQPLSKRGLNLLYAPGNDLVASTALAVSGAQIILFTTGRGTPFGSPVPTVKISSNTELFNRKPSWIDFDAGSIASGMDIRELSQELFNFAISVANGKRTNAEISSSRDLAIFKTGVTL